jgi:hypothetical protein
MAQRRAGRAGSQAQSLLEMVKRIEAQAARARTEAAADEEVDPWDLLDLDESISGPAWERYLGRPSQVRKPR